MYTRYYDSYPAVTNDVPPAPPAEAPASVQDIPLEEVTDEPVAKPASTGLPRLFGGLKTEDILLIALLFITTTDLNDDFLMPLILGALLLG